MARESFIDRLKQLHNLITRIYERRESLIMMLNAINLGRRRRHDAKIVSGPSRSPPEVRMLVFAHGLHALVHEHDVR